MRLRLLTFARPVAVTAIVAGCASGWACRPRMNSTELEMLQEGMAREMELQQATSERQEQVWEKLERSFDHDRDGQLNAGERMAFDTYLSRVKQGHVPNPFLGKKSPSD